MKKRKIASIGIIIHLAILAGLWVYEFIVDESSKSDFQVIAFAIILVTLFSLVFAFLNTCDINEKNTGKFVAINFAIGVSGLIHLISVLAIVFVVFHINLGVVVFIGLMSCILLRIEGLYIKGSQLKMQKVKQ